VYKGERREFINYSLHVNASSLLVLLAALGVPVGRKVSQTYGVPVWIKKSPLWMKRLFLASFFGAELTVPRAKRTKKGSFFAPVLSMNKRFILTKWDKVLRGNQ
jgi:tRNA-splicing ligase RtcB